MGVASTGKGLLLQVVGWVLVAAGLAALVLPGPGLLALFAGMAVLATQYEWAERRLEPVREAALRGAADSVQSWFRILLTVLGACVLVGLGVFWGAGPSAPSWWPVDERWWLVGGWGTGGTLIGSGVVVVVMLVYSYRNFRDPAREDPDGEAPGATPGAED